MRPQIDWSLTADLVACDQFHDYINYFLVVHLYRTWQSKHKHKQVKQIFHVNAAKLRSVFFLILLSISFFKHQSIRHYYIRQPICKITTLDMVRAGLHCSFKISRQMLPLLLIFGWKTFVLNATCKNIQENGNTVSKIEL